jgi:p-aminobenzoyl-glutamate transporter AbgT
MQILNNIYANMYPPIYVCFNYYFNLIIYFMFDLIEYYLFHCIIIPNINFLYARTHACTHTHPYKKWI